MCTTVIMETNIDEVLQEDVETVDTTLTSHTEECIEPLNDGRGDASSANSDSRHGLTTIDKSAACMQLENAKKRHDMAAPAYGVRAKERTGNAKIVNTENKVLRIRKETNVDTLFDSSDGIVNVELENEIKTLQQRLFEQEGIFVNEKEKIIEKKTECKKKVSDLFANLRTILDEKERGLTDKVEMEFNDAETSLIVMLDAILKNKASINRSRDTGDACLISDISSELATRDKIFGQIRVPDLNLNENVCETLQNFNIGNTLLSVCETAGMLSPTEQAVGNVGTSRNEIDIQFDKNFDLSEYSDNYSSTGYEESYASTEYDFDEESVFDSEEGFAAGSSQMTGACAMSVASPQSAAVAAPIPGDDPPPYWQAIGLQGPEEAQPIRQPEIPGYYDIEHSGPAIRPNNTLEMWHSFPVRRQNDRKQPMPTALLWNGDWICFADCNNMKVKFFKPNGKLVSEVFLTGHQISDVAFLESCAGESRYLVTCPHINALIIIFINQKGKSGVVRKFISSSAYTCVSRGPFEQTLVGGQAGDHGIPRVELFNFKGKLFKTLTSTPNNVHFQHPMAIEIWHHNVVVLDWRLQTVAIYKDDGTPVGEYRGSVTWPLLNPLDITLDQAGNILILDEELSQIHIIDQEANLIEVIKVPNFSTESVSLQFIAFNTNYKRIAIARNNSDILVLSFKNGYDCLSQGQSALLSPRQTEVLPLVEGMLPSTIENIVSRQPIRHRSRQFHL
ncbi:hypothetical protein DPMN_044479 [Dreissena polymorpha]|uniref:Uncharacterized protein n=1 Tax=Dreissena polymorpha TaxID=45954 RepID=A0A9D4D2C8_DREPO|nr:hypothetical protein DPMN_044479 [Dreissena polymorpha]